MGQIQSSFNIGLVIGPLIGSAVYEITVSEIFEIIGYSFFGGGIPFFIAGIFGLIQVFAAIYIFRSERNHKIDLVYRGI